MINQHSDINDYLSAAYKDDVVRVVETALSAGIHRPPRPIGPPKTIQTDHINPPKPYPPTPIAEQIDEEAPDGCGFGVMRQQTKGGDYELALDSSSDACQPGSPKDEDGDVRPQPLQFVVVKNHQESRQVTKVYLKRTKRAKHSATPRTLPFAFLLQIRRGKRPEVH